MLEDGKGSWLVLIGNRAGPGLSDRDGAGAIGGERGRITGRRILADGVGATPKQCFRGRAAGPVVASNRRDSVNRAGESARRRRSTVGVDHLLDDEQLRGDVAVGDGAGRAAAQRHGARTSRHRRCVTTGAGLAYAEAPGPNHNLDPGLTAREIIGRGISRSDMHGELVGRGRAAIVVDDVLDDGQCAGLVLVGDCARLRLTDSDRARPVSSVESRVTGWTTLTN